MATITLKYDTKNDLAVNIIDSIKSAGVFTVIEEKSPYNKEFGYISSTKSSLI